MSQETKQRINALEKELKELKREEKQRDRKEKNYGVILETSKFFVRTKYSTPKSDEIVCVLPKHICWEPAFDILENGSVVWNGPERAVCYFCKADIQAAIADLQAIMEVAPEKPITAKTQFNTKNE